MFFPVIHHVWRWDTPDPEAPWMMVGHLIMGRGGIVAVDPPVLPGLEEGLRRLGGLQAVVLTTHDHTRGAAYLQKIFQCPFYVPVQADAASLVAARLADAVPYGAGELQNFGLRAIRCRVVIAGSSAEDKPYLDEMLLTFGDDAIISGDLALGGPTGRLQLCPEGFTDRASPDKVKAVWQALNALIPATVTTLLAGHGQDIVGRFTEQLAARRPEP